MLCIRSSCPTPPTSGRNQSSALQSPPPPKSLTEAFIGKEDSGQAARHCGKNGGRIGCGGELLNAEVKEIKEAKLFADRAAKDMAGEAQPEGKMITGKIIGRRVT